MTPPRAAMITVTLSVVCFHSPGASRDEQGEGPVLVRLRVVADPSPTIDAEGEDEDVPGPCSDLFSAPPPPPPRVAAPDELAAAAEKAAIEEEWAIGGKLFRTCDYDVSYGGPVPVEQMLETGVSDLTPRLVSALENPMCESGFKR